MQFPILNVDIGTVFLRKLRTVHGHNIFRTRTPAKASIRNQISVISLVQQPNGILIPDGEFPRS